MAIKVLRPEPAAPVLRERFQREAEAAAGLRHRGIVPIFDIGGGGDLAWFVMPLVRGETLRDRLAREGRLPIGEARRIMVDTALALSVAHGAGIVHRDIKPDNILLEGDEHCVVLTDFGIAKSLGHAPGGTSLTTTGLVIGTPDYMSPEQAGGGANLDVRSDIYSLGVVTYQMLTGERPFSGHTPGAILMQQLRGPAPAVRARRQECPAVIADSVDRCLALEPGDRWESVEALVASLNRTSVPMMARAAPRSGTEAIGFRNLILGAAGIAAVAAGIDVVRGQVLLAPPVLLASLAVLAVRYGTWWTRGFGWRELWRLPVEPLQPRTDHPLVAQARGDRAATLRAYSALPRVEQALLPTLPARIDELVARVESLGRQPDDRRRSDITRIAKALHQLRDVVERSHASGVTTVRGEVSRLLDLAMPDPDRR